MTQLEHILLRPDTYIGSIEYAQEDMWVFDDVQKKMAYKHISYVPYALYLNVVLIFIICCDSEEM